MQTVTRRFIVARQSGIRLPKRHLFNQLFTPSPTKSHTERKVLPYPAELVFDVVAKVEYYKDFLPWCVKSTVLWRNPDSSKLRAELGVGFQLFQERYTSAVTLIRPTSIIAQAEPGGIFHFLKSKWEFKPGPVDPNNSCSVLFSIQYSFQSSVHSAITERFFQDVNKQMINAFEKRCQQLYGPPRFQNGSRTSQHSNSNNSVVS